VFAIKGLKVQGALLFDLEREALIASGLVDEERIVAYSGKLYSLSREYMPPARVDASPLERARAIFDALWKDRSNRYSRQGQFRFDRVIDAQIERKNRPVGNCLGLTVLYNCLLKKTGIQAQAVYLENAFEIGPHVLTSLRIGNTKTDIENILEDGFDYKGHKDNPSRLEWGDRELVADIYQSAGTECFEKKEFREALRNYNSALKFYPAYEKVKLNKAILVDRIMMIGNSI
jgi:hypothetical protein